MRAAGVWGLSEVFVFGSNLAGRHGAGSAKHARDKWGAQIGVGEGRTGNAYAIPTKDRELRVLPPDIIGEYVRRFLSYASEHPEITFKVVAIGCGLAGYRPTQIAPMFASATPNIILPPEFR